ncbi:MAG: pyridoxamine 5'-phosphate oxidase family protein [Paracoccaceae bacterium]
MSIPVFHSGETSVQDRAGVPLRAREMAAKVIRGAMPDQHQAFFEALPLVFLALLDRRGRPWAIPMQGAPGFLKATSPRQLVLQGTPALAGALSLDIAVRARVGMLGIDFATRRRNRLNGRIASGDENLTIAVDQSFGNCPKYIQIRAFEQPGSVRQQPVLRQIQLNSPAARRTVGGADTFFIASRGADPADGTSSGLDVSHRGGRPGFLGIDAGGKLSLPDFAGNRYFNTLGNIEADGRVGLLVPDFATGRALALTGRAKIDWSCVRRSRAHRRRLA